MPELREDLRNVAIVAHVDHGKTTLVDAMLWQSGAFRVGQDVNERVMDSMDLEREKGITILAKNTSVRHLPTGATSDVKLNIIDTPGHADFGGEVERGLFMVDGILLLVDASEGPLPQTRFVLRKALEARLPVILVVNKVDRPDARISRGHRRGLRAVPRPRRRRGADRVPDRLLQRAGRPRVARGSRRPVRQPAPAHGSARRADSRARVRARPSAAGAGHEPRRLALRRPARALPRAPGHDQARPDGRLVSRRRDDRERRRSPSCTSPTTSTASRPTRPGPGEIIAIAGIPEITIGETLADPDDPRPLPVISVDEPSLSVTIGINTSPLSGQRRLEGHRPPAAEPARRRAHRQRRPARARHRAARTPGRSRAAASCSSRCSSRSCAARATS